MNFLFLFELLVEGFCILCCRHMLKKSLALANLSDLWCSAWHMYCPFCEIVTLPWLGLMDVNPSLLLSLLLSLTFALSQCMWGWLVCLITVECADFKVSVSLFASDQVVLCSRWSYGSMVRAPHGHTWKQEERNNRSARWGSHFSLMRLEACTNTGETITTRFLLSTLVPLISLLV